MSPIIALSVLLGLGAITAMVIYANQAGIELVAYQLRFPRGLATKAVLGFLAGQRELSLAIETHATQGGIVHLLVTQRRLASRLENLLQASLPWVRYARVPVPELRLSAAHEYRLREATGTLRSEPDELSAKVLSNLQPLRRGEAIVIQWLITPKPRRSPLADMAISVAQDFGLGRVPEPTTEQRSAERRKHEHPVLQVRGRIGAHAEVLPRALQLIGQVESAWGSAQSKGVRLQRRQRRPDPRARARLTERSPGSNKPLLLNTQELSGLIGWPIGVEQLPGLSLGGCRQLAPPVQVPIRGTVIGDATFPGAERPVALPVDARLRHLATWGPTGTGKSTLLGNLIIQDLAAGHGVIVLDPRGDLIEDVLARVPSKRSGDVIVLDPADDDFPVGLNPLATGGERDVEVVAENVLGLFRSLYRASWGPRLDQILRSTLLSIASVGGTLCEVPLILTDPTYRRRVVGQIDDPLGLEPFWAWYESLSDGERINAIGPVLNKVDAAVGRRRVRGIVGQACPALDLGQVLARRQVLLVNLAPGLLGSEAASLLGALVMAELWHAVQARAGLPPAQRRPVMAYIDEFQKFLHLETPLADVLAEARGLGLGLTLAHQHLHQLSADVREALLANARSRICFQVATGDARLLASHFGSSLTPEDLQGLGAYEVVAQLFAQGHTQAPLTGRTRELPPASSDPAAIRSRSRERFGTPRAEVEASILARRQPGKRGPVGSRPRPHTDDPEATP